MSRLTLTILAAMSLAANCAMAQSAGTLNVSIPFDFMAGPQVYPAGDYHVAVQAGVIRIQDGNFKLMGVLLSHAVQAPDNGPAAVRFTCYNDRYFLSQVLTGSSVGRELPKSAPEREQIATYGKPSTLVTLAATR